MSKTVVYLSNLSREEKKSKERMYKILKQCGDITVGLDIEVLWAKVDRDTSSFINIIPADSVFTKEGICGTDGRSLIGEFRVSPSVDTRILVEFFEYALQLSKQFLDVSNIKIHPFGMAYYSSIYPKVLLNESIGAHIHFGNSFLRKIHKELVQALDVLVLPFSKVFEPPVGNFIRTGTGFYGDLSDFRLKDYGVEYRSTPCFFDSKEITQGILALSKIVAFETLPGGILVKEFLDTLKIKRYLLHDKKYLKFLCKKSEIIIKKTCSMYPIYKKELDLLFSYVEKNTKYEDFDRGIFTEWNIKTENLNYLEKEIVASNRLNLNLSYIHSNMNEKIDRTKMLKVGGSRRG